MKRHNAIAAAFSTLLGSLTCAIPLGSLDLLSTLSPNDNVTEASINVLTDLGIPFPPGQEPTPDWRHIRIPDSDITLVMGPWFYQPALQPGGLAGILQEIRTQASDPAIHDQFMKLSPHHTRGTVQYFGWDHENMELRLYIRIRMSVPVWNITWGDMANVASGLDRFGEAYPLADFGCSVYEATDGPQKRYLGFIRFEMLSGSSE